MRKLRHTIALLCVLAAGATFAATASAADYCVGESATSTLCPTGSQDYAFDQSGLQAALTQAASVALSPGPDRVLIADGTITMSSAVSITPTAGETVEIVGEGNGASRLAVGATAAQALFLNFSSVPTSQVRGLTFDVPGRPGSAARGLLMLGAGRIAECEFLVTGDGSFSDYGIEGSATLDITDSTFTLTGVYAYAMYTTGDLTLSGSTFTGDPAGNNYAIQASGMGQRTVRRSVFRNHYRAISFDQGNVDVYDTLIEIGSQSNASGIYAGNSNNGIGTATLDVDGATIIGTLSNQVGVHMEAGSTNPAGEAMITTIKNTVFRLPTTELRCREDDDGATVYGTSTLTIDHTLLDPAKYTATGSGSCDKTESAMLDGSAVTPLFVDAAAGDYRPAPGSPVIEAGDPATDTSSRAVDAGGAVRFVDADGDGGDTIDLGAYEFQPSAPTVPAITASTSTPIVGDTVSFTAASTDANGDPLTYDWAFGDGGVATGASTSHAFTATGAFAVTVTVSDGTGRSNQGSVVIQVAAPPLVPSPSPVVKFGRATGKFKRTGKAFSIAGSSTKSHVPVTANVATEVTITLYRKRGGYRSGSRCVSRKPRTGVAKRCNLKLKGSQTLSVPAGSSVLLFGGKWRGRRLATGHYDAFGVARGSKESTRAVLNVIR